MNPTSPESTWPLTSTNQKPLLPRHQNNHLNTILMHHPWYKENIHTPLHSNSWFLAIRQKSFRIFPSNSPTHLDLIWIRCHERNALRKTKNRGVCRAESHRQKRKTCVSLVLQKQPEKGHMLAIWHPEAPVSFWVVLLQIQETWKVTIWCHMHLDVASTYAFTSVIFCHLLSSCEHVPIKSCKIM